MDAAKTPAQRYVAAWMAVENPPLDKTNPHFKNRYASLAVTLEAVRAACAPQGIAYRQTLVRLDDGTRALRSSIMTDAGEEMPLSEFPVEAPPNPQSFGSNLTYAKRQQAQADWGIVGEEDDDAEAAVNGNQGRPAAQPQHRGVNGQCKNCRNVYVFHSVEHMASAICQQCGCPEFEVM